jgi:hypothetical protein
MTAEHLKDMLGRMAETERIVRAVDSREDGYEHVSPTNALLNHISSQLSVIVALMLERRA